jgi:hypothetical protein
LVLAFFRRRLGGQFTDLTTIVVPAAGRLPLVVADVALSDGTEAAVTQ